MSRQFARPQTLALLVPKLWLGNVVLQALACFIGLKLELQVRSSQAGAWELAD